MLLTGEVPTEADKAAVEKAVAQISTVRATVNDIAVMPTSSLATGSNDSIITGKVKAAIFDAKNLQVATIKVVTERGIVYLMGLVTEAEAARAVEVARVVGVVRRWWACSRSSRRRNSPIQAAIDPKPAAPPASGPAKP